MSPRGGQRRGKGKNADLAKELEVPEAERPDVEKAIERAKPLIKEHKPQDGKS